MTNDSSAQQHELEHMLEANQRATHLLHENQRVIASLHQQNEQLIKRLSGATGDASASRTAHSLNKRDVAIQTVTDDPDDDIEALRARYDEVLQEKLRLEAQYQADYRKWREFKTWLLKGKRPSTSHLPQTITPQSIVKLKRSKTSWQPGERSLASAHDLLETVVTAAAPRPSGVAFGHLNTPSASIISKTASSSIREARTSIATREDQLTSLSLVQAASHRSNSEAGGCAREPFSDDGTINTRFQLNATKNGGRDYKFDEIVRRKHERRHLEGGDCECCHDYYEAIDTLPHAPQGPLWRSPPRTPTKRRHGGHDRDVVPSKRSHTSAKVSISPLSSPTKSPSSKRREAIVGHKKEISKHRQQWAAPKTPPGYWDIGFPDTQEAAVINRHAEDMHQQRRREVEKEANKRNGRYVRR